MKADEGEGEGSEFSAVLESFSFFFFKCVQINKAKQASANACLHAKLEVCERMACVCVCVCARE